MSPLFERLSQLVLAFLPPVDPNLPEIQEYRERVMRWLKICSPIVSALDAKAPRAVLNQATIVDFLNTALAANEEEFGEGQLAIEVVPPAEVVHLPCKRRGYNLFYAELVGMVMDNSTDAVVQQFGHEAFQKLVDQLWQTIGSQLIERMFDLYPDLARHVSPGVYSMIFQGHYETFLAFVLASVADEEDTVMELAPLVRQLPMGVIVGTCAGDPQRWYVLLPGESGNDGHGYDGDNDFDDE